MWEGINQVLVLSLGELCPLNGVNKNKPIVVFLNFVLQFLK